MTNTTPNDRAAVLQAIERARREYKAVLSDLKAAVAEGYADPPDATDRLYTHAEEFGVDHAYDLLLRRPEAFGATRSGQRAPWSETAGRVSDLLTRLVELQDDLDGLTGRRDGEGTAGGDTRALNIQGREYELHAVDSTLRDIETGERVSISLEPRDPARELSQTERFAQERNIGAVEIGREQPKTRSR